jgi:hypothetical protein
MVHYNKTTDSQQICNGQFSVFSGVSFGFLRRLPLTPYAIFSKLARCPSSLGLWSNVAARLGYVFLSAAVLGTITLNFQFVLPLVHYAG